METSNLVLNCSKCDPYCSLPTAPGTVANCVEYIPILKMTERDGALCYYGFVDWKSTRRRDIFSQDADIVLPTALTNVRDNLPKFPDDANALPRLK